MTKLKTTPLNLQVSNSAFQTGQITVTKGVHDLACHDLAFARFLQECLNSHVEVALKRTKVQGPIKECSKFSSAYKDERFPKHGAATIWIITEADHSYTTILFPDEY